jgi:hypothetical protein
MTATILAAFEFALKVVGVACPTCPSPGVPPTVPRA